MYKQTRDALNNITNAVIRLQDNAWIPFDPANCDYTEYLEWLSLGNTPIPADEPTLPE